jgi:aryl carrier-like protein
MAAKFVANPFVSGGRMYRTGDLARLTSSGIQMLGRLDHQVKLRGFRIELGEIETAVCAHGGVAVALAVLRIDPPRPARLVCYYVERLGQPRDAAMLQAALADVVPDYMVPSAWVRLDAMPLTPNGKIDRKALPAPSLEATQNVRHAPLLTATQQRLGEIWQEVLGVPEVGADDDVLALGADSIHLFQIAARATRSGIRVAVKDLLRHRNISALTGALEQSLQGDAQKTGGPPRLSQFRRVRQHQA